MTPKELQKILLAVYPAYSEFQKLKSEMYPTKAAIGLVIKHPATLRTPRHVVHQGLIRLYRNTEAIRALEDNGFVVVGADDQDYKGYTYAIFTRPHCERDKMSDDDRCIWENVVAEVVGRLVIVELPSPIIWRHSMLGWLWQYAACCDASKENKTPWRGRVCQCQRPTPWIRQVSAIDLLSKDELGAFLS